MKRLICVVAIVVIGTKSLFAQYSAEQRDSIKHAQYRQEIGLDMAVPDFEATEIDPNVIGPRLANLLYYLLENYQQGIYNQKLAQITREQVPALEKEYFDIKKLTLIRASKQGNRVDIIFKV